MVCQKALLWQIHDAGILSVEGVLGMDLINRQDAIDLTYAETVNTNPEHFKSSEKFIGFMDDIDISDFGRWQVFYRDS